MTATYTPPDKTIEERIYLAYASYQPLILTALPA